MSLLESNLFLAFLLFWIFSNIQDQQPCEVFPCTTNCRMIMIKSTHRATQMSNISLPSCVSSQTPGVSLPMAQSPWANTTETLGQEANSNSPAIVANVSVPIQPTLSHQGTSCNMALSALTSPWKQLCVAHLPTKQRRFPSLALKPSPASSPPHPYTNALLVSSACHHSAS